MVIKSLISRGFIKSLPLYLTRGAVVGFNLLATLAAAAILEPAEFGRFVFLWALAQMLGAVASLGGQNYLMREFSARQGDQNRGIVPQEAFAIAVIAPLLILVAIGVTVWLLEPYLIFRSLAKPLGGSEIVLVCCTSWMFIILGHLAIPFRLQERLTLSMLLQDAGPHVSLLLALVVLIIIEKPNAVTLLAGFAGVSLFATSVLAVIACATHRNSIPLWRESGSSVRGKGLRYFWGSSVLGNSTSQIDILVGALFLNSVDLGQYQILKRLANLGSLPQIVANWTVVIGVGRSFAENNLKRVQDLCRTGVAIAFVPGVLMLGIIALLLPAVMHYYDIPVSLDRWAIFLLLGAANLINLACGVNFIVAAQCNFERHVLIARLAGVLVAIITILSLSDMLTPQGLAFSTLLSFATANLMLTYFLHRRLSIDTTVLSLRKYLFYKK